jgi:hypothetical protein
MDSAARRRVADYCSQRPVSDATMGHKPGPVQDQLGGFQIHDAALADAREARDLAFRNLCRRSERAWMSDAKQRLEQLGAENGNGGEETDEPDENGDPDDLLERARLDRDAALRARDERGNNAWRPSAPASEVLAREKAWRHGA